MDPHDPFAPDSHEPNLSPPTQDPTIRFTGLDGLVEVVTPEYLAKGPRSTVFDYSIVSTGHGASGPFEFSGVALLDLIRRHGFRDDEWWSVEVLGADGFGARITADQLLSTGAYGPVLVADTIDGRPMAREEGLVRLIVPDERDDALRQIKWIASIHIRSAA